MRLKSRDHLLLAHRSYTTRNSHNRLLTDSDCPTRRSPVGSLLLEPRFNAPASLPNVYRNEQSRPIKIGRSLPPPQVVSRVSSGSLRLHALCPMIGSGLSMPPGSHRVKVRTALSVLDSGPHVRDMSIRPSRVRRLSSGRRTFRFSD